MLQPLVTGPSVSEKPPSEVWSPARTPISRHGLLNIRSSVAPFCSDSHSCPKTHPHLISAKSIFTTLSIIKAHLSLRCIKKSHSQKPHQVLPPTQRRNYRNRQLSLKHTQKHRHPVIPFLAPFLTQLRNLRASVHLLPIVASPFSFLSAGCASPRRK